MAEQTASGLVNAVIVGMIPVILAGFMWVLAKVDSIEDKVYSIRMEVVVLRADLYMSNTSLVVNEKRIHRLINKIQKISNVVELPDWINEPLAPTPPKRERRPGKGINTATRLDIKGKRYDFR